MANPQKGYGCTMVLDAAPNNKTIARVRDVTLDHPEDTADATSRASGGWDENVPTLDEWSVSGEMVRVADSDSYTKMLDAWLADTVFQCVLTTPNGQTRTGNCYIEEMNIDCAMGRVVGGTFKLQGTGALVYA